VRGLLKKSRALQMEDALAAAGRQNTTADITKGRV